MVLRARGGQQGTILRLASSQEQGKNLPQAGAVLYPPEGGAVWYPPKFMKFYYVYVLYNKSKNFIYIGYSEDLQQRLKDHNDEHSKSTKPYLPLELIHYEAYRNKKDAKRREEYLKTNRGRTTLMTMLKEYFEDRN